MLLPSTTILVRITIGTSMGTITTKMWEIIVEETTSTLLITIMASKGRTDNGIHVQIMEAFLLTITTKMFSMHISINMMIVKICATMMVHTIKAIKR